MNVDRNCTHHADILSESLEVTVLLTSAYLDIIIRHHHGAAFKTVHGHAPKATCFELSLDENLNQNRNGFNR